MIALSPEASEQLGALERFYIEKRRPQALRNLGHALAEASLLILNAPERGRPFPRPYPELQSVGLSWIKRGRTGLHTILPVRSSPGCSLKPTTFPLACGGEHRCGGFRYLRPHKNVARSQTPKHERPMPMQSFHDLIQS